MHKYMYQARYRQAGGITCSCTPFGSDLARRAGRALCSPGQHGKDNCRVICMCLYDPPSLCSVRLVRAWCWIDNVTEAAHAPSGHWPDAAASLASLAFHAASPAGRCVARVDNSTRSRRKRGGSAVFRCRLAAAAVEVLRAQQGRRSQSQMAHGREGSSTLPPVIRQQAGQGVSKLPSWQPAANMA